MPCLLVGGVAAFSVSHSFELTFFEFLTAGHAKQKVHILCLALKSCEGILNNFS